MKKTASESLPLNEADNVVFWTRVRRTFGDEKFKQIFKALERVTKSDGQMFFEVKDEMELMKCRKDESLSGFLQNILKQLGR